MRSGRTTTSSPEDGITSHPLRRAPASSVEWPWRLAPREVERPGRADAVRAIDSPARPRSWRTYGRAAGGSLSPSLLPRRVASQESRGGMPTGHSDPQVAPVLPNATLTAGRADWLGRPATTTTRTAWPKAESTSSGMARFGSHCRSGAFSRPSLRADHMAMAHKLGPYDTSRNELKTDKSSCCVLDERSSTGGKPVAVTTIALPPVIWYRWNSRSVLP
jgi:hypothetical protein